MPILKHYDTGWVGPWPYHMWSAGCICGFYTKGSPGYIPSEGSALRIYNSHLPQTELSDEEEPEIPESPPMKCEDCHPECKACIPHLIEIVDGRALCKAHKQMREHDQHTL